jgi:hypothetical protein
MGIYDGLGDCERIEKKAPGPGWAGRMKLESKLKPRGSAKNVPDPFTDSKRGNNKGLSIVVEIEKDS